MLFYSSSLPCFLYRLCNRKQNKKNHIFMAVEARHMDLLPSQLIPQSHRNFVKSNQGNIKLCNTQMDSFTPFAEIIPESVLPWYQNLDCNPISAKTSMDKADSGLTYNIPAPRKRPRDSIYDFDAFSPVSQKNKLSGFSSFVNEDVILQFQQQQSEIDRYIAQHAEKVRFELEERRKSQSRMLVSAIEEGIAKKLKEKDQEIQRMGKLNWVLQERVKSLYVENQLWRDLAHTNEATANSLRSNLEQVLAQVSGDTVAEDDAESSCGSSDYGRCTKEGAQDKGVKKDRGCRKCGERESSVLVLPCRHLCLCTVCGSSLHGCCPVCNSLMDATLHINLS
ncbi:hypothetical protein ACOSP7_013078 [Xanthoceras sorbifolium]|uniref:RING-type domain-containing protein n=1 Tax=Xanthoceras sorbifolium TaxID=99658 RepID=A0ABQ8HZE3_9ROSI|nr:hypothetical protein JRO89_XS06G0196900 [Xanthoceras sorbifolium]